MRTPEGPSNPYSLLSSSFLGALILLPTMLLSSSHTLVAVGLMRDLLFVLPSFCLSARRHESVYLSLFSRDRGGAAPGRGYRRRKYRAATTAGGLTTGATVPRASGRRAAAWAAHAGRFAAGTPSAGHWART